MSHDYIDPLSLPPEEMKPDDVLVLLVGITRHGEFNYYVLPRHLVFLDGAKAKRDGYGPPFYDGMEGRFGIMTVDEAHEEEFFRAIEPHKRTPERLREELCACGEGIRWMGSYYIEVLMDFDRKHLASYFCEPFEFEEYVPDGWTSEFGGIGCDPDYFFMDDSSDGKPEKNIGIGGLEKDYIPLDKRFWIDENGKSIFKMLYEKENNT